MRKRWSKEDILAASRGRMRELLENVAGIHADYLVTDHEGPCPKCGGNTRFRFIDEDKGAVRCSHCFSERCGDIFAAICWMKDWDARGDFGRLLQAMGEYLQVPPLKPGRSSNENGRPKADTGSVETPKIIPASSEVLDKAYRALLEQLELEPADHEKLIARGLSSEQIAAAGYRTWRKTNKKAHLAAMAAVYAVGNPEAGRIPGIYRGRLLARGDGILIPCRNALRQIIALKVRYNEEIDGIRYGYASSKKYGASCGSPVHVPLPVQVPCEVARLTEGELKADVSTALSGVPTISCGGVGMWKRAIPVLKEMGAKVVLLAFDADVTTNKAVADQLQKACKGLADENFEVKLERWNAEDGKGIDDLYAGGKKPDVLDGYWVIDELRKISDSAEAAEDEEKKQAANALVVRAQSRIKEGGEALFGDTELLKDLAQLAATDAAAFSIVRVAVKSNKIGVRDFDKAIKQFAPRKEKSVHQWDDVHGFCEAFDCLCFLQQMEGDEHPVELCNFSARVVDETVRDDGVETKIYIGLAGKLQNGKPLQRIEVSGNSFGECDWIIPGWGSDAIVWPGNKYKVVAAIQALSSEKQKRTVYTHTGWRQVGDRWVYLHAGGCIGGDPDDEVAVDLRPPLNQYILPDPSTVNIREGIEACFRFLDLTHPRITYPLFATVIRAAIGDADFSTFLVGTSGVFKSEIAALAQQFFGPRLDGRHLPGNWSSTENALEQTAFLAKDALFVIDDFAPAGGAGDVARLHKAADRIFRAQGNHSGRQRLTVAGELRPQKPPRCMVMATGEEVPWGQSLRARLFIIEIEKGDIASPDLTLCQADGAAGLYAGVMARFIEWLVPGFATIKQGWSAKVTESRTRAGGSHARTPAIVAELDVAFRCFLLFAEKMGAINEETKLQLRDFCWKALNETTEDQSSQQSASDPAQHFMRLIVAAVGMGRAHIAYMDGTEPEYPNRWGWRSRRTKTSTGGYEEDWQPHGRRIGWTDGQYVYLEPEASYAEAQTLARDQGQVIAILPKTMHKRLRESGFIEAIDEIRNTATRRKTIEGNYRELLWLGVSHFPEAPVEDREQF